MTDEPSAEEMEAVTALLSDPTLWAEPSPDVEDRVLAAIAAEMTGRSQLSDSGDPYGLDEVGQPVTPLHRVDSGQHGEPPPMVDPAPTGRYEAIGGHAEPIDLGARRARRRWVMPAAAAAAVVAVALAAVTLVDVGQSTEFTEVALAGTDLAPAASATAQIERRPNGDRILLSLDDLPAAPEGFFYAAWVIEDDPAFRVGAGTFHMRGGNGMVELWTGVSTDTYRTVSVTLQSVDDPNGPGEVVLRGHLDPDATG